jgi:hypothetical protein
LAAAEVADDDTGDAGSYLDPRGTEIGPESSGRCSDLPEAAQADSLLDQLKDLQAKALAILQRAEGTGDLRTATAAIGQARQNLELLGKLAGELGPDTQVNVLVEPDWHRIRTVLMEALAPYLEARVAAAEAIRRLGDGAAA